MEHRYELGLLLEARKNLHAFYIVGQKVIKNIIPYKSCVTLLSCHYEHKTEDITVLYNGKIFYIINIDLEHDFRILSSDNN
jgi:hypothetical protein